MALGNILQREFSEYLRFRENISGRSRSRENSLYIYDSALYVTGRKRSDTRTSASLPARPRVSGSRKYLADEDWLAPPNAVNRGRIDVCLRGIEAATTADSALVTATQLNAIDVEPKESKQQREKKRE